MVSSCSVESGESMLTNHAGAGRLDRKSGFTEKAVSGFAFGNLAPGCRAESKRHKQTANWPPLLFLE
jgi:hypothetical protein